MIFALLINMAIAEQAKLISQLTGFFASMNNHNSQSASIADSLCMLQKSYRFDARSGIGQLLRPSTLDLRLRLTLFGKKTSMISLHFPVDALHYRQMIQTLVAEYSHYLNRKPTMQGIDDETIYDVAKESLHSFSLTVACFVPLEKATLVLLDSIIVWNELLRPVNSSRYKMSFGTMADL